MKKILFLLIAALGVLMVAASVYASDQTDTTGATINGEAIHTMSITSGSSMSYHDPGDMGPQTYELTGSPVTLVIADNDVAVGIESGTSIVTTQVTGTIPEQYGLFNREHTYFFATVSGATWTPDADNDVTPVGINQTYGGVIAYSDNAPFDVLVASDTTTGKVLTGHIDLPVSLLVNNERRIYGGTSDSLTITFTFIDL